MKTYEVVFDKLKNKGVYGISLVHDPAMEGVFVALSKEDNKIKLAEIDKEQRILIGLVLEPNKPIYRNQDGEEFNIIFNEETIKDLSHNFFISNNQSNSTLEHEDKQQLKGVTFVESWIVEDSKIDKSANFGMSYPKGSWIATMKVDNDEIWNNYVKTGEVKGFSVDAMVNLKEINLKSEIKSSDDLLGVLKCVGYETTQTIYNPETFKPYKGFISMNYNDIRNERKTNTHWKDWIRTREQDKKT